MKNASSVDISYTWSCECWHLCTIRYKQASIYLIYRSIMSTCVVIQPDASISTSIYSADTVTNNHTQQLHFLASRILEYVFTLLTIFVFDDVMLSSAFQIWEKNVSLY